MIVFNCVKGYTMVTGITTHVTNIVVRYADNALMGLHIISVNAHIKPKVPGINGLRN